jgi:hypothetical protein
MFYKKEVGQAQTLVDLSKEKVDALEEVKEEEEEDIKDHMPYKDDS